MILNGLFILVLILLCYTRYKEVCKDCGSDKFKDIFQILTVGISFAYIIGVDRVLIMLGVILASFVLREVLFYPVNIIKKKKCKNCIDTFK